jgi:S-adenosylmethionine decarboxylase
MERKLGRHLICEVTDCSFEKLDDVTFLEQTLTEACKMGGAGVISVQSKKFEPQGATVLVLLSESHCSIHTWPEYGYASVDVFTCGTHVEPYDILVEIRKRLSCHIKVTEIDRGIPKKNEDL